MSKGKYEITLVLPMRQVDYKVFRSDSRNIKEWCRIYGANKGFVRTAGGKYLSGCALKSDASLERPEWEYIDVKSFGGCENDR